MLSTGRRPERLRIALCKTGVPPQSQPPKRENPAPAAATHHHADASIAPPRVRLPAFTELMMMICGLPSPADRPDHHLTSHRREARYPLGSAKEEGRRPLWNAALPAFPWFEPAALSADPNSLFVDAEREADGAATEDDQRPEDQRQRAGDLAGLRDRRVHVPCPHAFPAHGVEDDHVEAGTGQ